MADVADCFKSSKSSDLDWFTMKDIMELYESVTLDARFVRLSNLHDMPLAFGQTIFNTTFFDECFDMTDYLLNDLDCRGASCKVSSGAESCATSSFELQGSSTVTSAGDGTIEVKQKQGNTSLMGFEHEDKIDISSPRFQEAVKRLNACFTKENLASIRKIGETKFSDEACITAALGIHIIKKLSGGAFTTKKIQEMQCLCGCQPLPDEKLDVGNMYIGTENTWHGALDLISGTVAMTTSLDIKRSFFACAAAEDAVGGAGDDSVDRNAEENDGKIKASGSSPGERTNVEVKTRLPAVRNETIYQILSQAIVFGWTEYNRHKEYSPFIPSVFIDNQKFVIVVYNPTADSLMVSKICCFEKDNKEINHAAIFLLWLVLNHRIFFRKHTVQYEKPCGFKCQMETKPYEELHDFQSCVRAYLQCLQLEVSQSNLRVRIKRKRSFTE